MSVGTQILQIRLKVAVIKNHAVSAIESVSWRCILQLPEHLPLGEGNSVQLARRLVHIHPKAVGILGATKVLEGQDWLVEKVRL